MRALPRDGVRLEVRLLLSGRDYHSTHHENPGFRFDAEESGEAATWRPYAGVPSIHAATNGRYRHRPEWYRNFLYGEEQARGLDDVEDLASPGTFTFDLGAPAAMLLTSNDDGVRATSGVLAALDCLHQRERQRRIFPTPLHRAADTFLVQRGTGKRWSRAIRGSPTGAATRSSR